MSKVNIHNALSLITKPWQPHHVASANDYEVKAATLLGDFHWHKHDDTDEMLYIVSGNLTMELRDGNIDLTAGDFCVIPRGVEHRPSAKEHVEALLFEPKAL